MAMTIKFSQTEIAEEDFPLDNMVAVVKSKKVFEPTVEGKDKTTINPTIEFIDEGAYTITGKVRDLAAQAFMDSRIGEDLTTSEAFKKVNMAFKGNAIAYDVAAAGSYDLATFFGYLHDNLGSIPDDPEPEPEPEEEEAPAEEAAEAEAEG
ncbi:MAG: hypothetical protein ACPGOV_12080 [Magnetovibrionaceae bacterium]